MDDFEKMSSVKQMKDFVLAQNINTKEVYDVVIPKMDELIKNERLFGSMKESFIKWLKENCI